MGATEGARRDGRLSREVSMGITEGGVRGASDEKESAAPVTYDGSSRSYEAEAVAKAESLTGAGAAAPEEETDETGASPRKAWASRMGKPNAEGSAVSVTVDGSSRSSDGWAARGR